MLAKQTLFALASLAASAYAANFKLVAQVTANDLTPSVNGQLLTTFTIHGCGRVAQFSSTQNFDTVWTTTDRTTVALADGHNNEISVVPGGTATVPSGATVGVNCGNGTPGVTIQNGALAFENGSWMACPNTVLQRFDVDQNAVLLSFKKAGQRSLAGCADVTLKAVAA